MNKRIFLLKTKETFKIETSFYIHYINNNIDIYIAIKKSIIKREFKLMVHENLSSITAIENHNDEFQ